VDPVRHRPDRGRARVPALTAASILGAALHELFLASIGGVFRPHAFAPPQPSFDVFAGQQRHIRATGTSVVAHDGPRIAGFASAWARGHDWFLASLFVAADVQGGGIGRALLDAVWGDHARRRTITDAIQPVSNMLYGRRGLVPATPLLAFSGRPARSEAPLTAGAGPVAAIDAAAYGFDRRVDHDHWSGIAERTVWLRDAVPVAYSYRFADGTLGPVAGVDPAAAATALESELARADDPVRVRMPGSSRTLVEVALRAGLTLSPTPGLLLLSEGVRPPTSLAIASFSLF
jgi:GNAT superfamily N-acetyltransferase